MKLQKFIRLFYKTSVAAIFLVTVAISVNANPHQSITLTKRQLCDLELIMNGGFAPLNGFMTKKDYENVVENKRLADGSVWTIPVVLDIDKSTAEKLSQGWRLILKSPEGDLLATMEVSEVYQPDRMNEVFKVYGTTNPEHPGVDYILNQTKPYYVGGTVTHVSSPKHYDFVDLRRTPEQLKTYFKENNITKVVAFQTRNPMHRSHYELTWRAAEEAGAHLLIHPVVGLTKPGDVDHFTRVHCYKALFPHYPQGSATLSLLPLAMRMAGPREAVWHALIRKNHGCTHFIVGRDHAGPGSDSKGVPFYGPYDAQDMVKQFAAEIGITPIFFNEMLYLPDTDVYMPSDKVPQATRTLSISGTQLRALLRDGKDIPSWFTFPEVAHELQKSYPPRNKQGFTIFFTGLSGSGKSTIANALALRLMEIQDRSVSILDGDEVRKHLSTELGFSKEHRSLNIRRIGYVAHEITKNGGVAICAAIAPYKDDRDYDRNLIAPYGGFIEVHISTTLEECEKRDVKGLYAKARAGVIPQFTGISDPYEAPLKPEVTIDTTKVSIEEALVMITEYLKKEGYLN